jgi:hypothetical protein
VSLTIEGKDYRRTIEGLSRDLDGSALAFNVRRIKSMKNKLVSRKVVEDVEETGMEGDRYEEEAGMRKEPVGRANA